MEINERGLSKVLKINERGLSKVLKINERGLSKVLKINERGLSKVLKKISTLDNNFRPHSYSSPLNLSIKQMDTIDILYYFRILVKN